MYTGKILNAIDAQKIGFVNEIIDDGIDGRNRLINKIQKEIAIYKMVIQFPNLKIYIFHLINIPSNFNFTNFTANSTYKINDNGWSIYQR